MNKDKLILKDGTEIELEAGASLGAIQVAAADRAVMVAIWEKMTEENLKEIQVQNGAGLTVGRYQDVILERETSVIKDAGSVLTTYALREKTKEEKRLDNLEEGQDVQDGAIMELATMVAGGDV